MEEMVIQMLVVELKKSLKKLAEFERKIDSGEAFNRAQYYDVLGAVQDFTNQLERIDLEKQV